MKVTFPQREVKTSMIFLVANGGPNRMSGTSQRDEGRKADPQEGITPTDQEKSKRSTIMSE